MKISAKHVIGLPVFNIQTGTQIDKVEDIVYNPLTNKVEALVIDEGGWFSDAKVVLIEGVESIGRDAVVIDTIKHVKRATDVSGDVKNIVKGENYLTTDKVITKDGTDLGNISDILFDPDTGKVEEFEVTQGALKDVGEGMKRIKTTDIITVGQDAMMVSKHTEVKFDKQAQKQGVQGAFNKAQKEVPNLMEQVKNEAKNLNQKAQEKTKQIKEDPGTQKMVQKVKQKSEEAGKTLNTKAKEVRKTAEQQIEQYKKPQQTKDSQSRESEPEVSVKTGYPAPESGQYQTVGAMGGKSEVTLSEGETTPPARKGEEQEYKLTDKTKHSSDK